MGNNTCFAKKQDWIKCTSWMLQNSLPACSLAVWRNEDAGKSPKISKPEALGEKRPLHMCSTKVHTHNTHRWHSQQLIQRIFMSCGMCCWWPQLWITSTAGSAICPRREAAVIRRRWGKIPVRGVSGSLLLQAASKMVTQKNTTCIFKDSFYFQTENGKFIVLFFQILKWNMTKNKTEHKISSR